MCCFTYFSGTYPWTALLLSAVIRQAHNYSTCMFLCVFAVMPFVCRFCFFFRIIPSKKILYDIVKFFYKPTLTQELFSYWIFASAFATAKLCTQFIKIVISIWIGWFCKFCMEIRVMQKNINNFLFILVSEALLIRQNSLSLESWLMVFGNRWIYYQKLDSKPHFGTHRNNQFSEFQIQRKTVR